MNTIERAESITKAEMDCADRIWWTNRQTENYHDILTLSEALPADLMSRVRSELHPATEAEAIEVATLVALRVQFTYVNDIAEGNRISLYRSWMMGRGKGHTKADLAAYATRKGVTVAPWDTKNDIYELLCKKLYPKTNWFSFVAAQ